MPPERDYPIGYKKPPTHSQFKPGQSGNPRGRPRGAKSHFTLLRQALDEMVPAVENGRQTMVSKRKAMYKQLANRAAQGDQRAIQIVLREIENSERARDKTPNEAPLQIGGVLVIPDNGRDQLDPELQAMYIETALKFEKKKALERLEEGEDDGGSSLY